MKQQGLFIIGTDTDVGKTFITARLGGLFQKKGYHVGMNKPIASGALVDETGHLYSGDAQELMRLTNIPAEETSIVNPICLGGEFSPKVAALRAQVTIPVAELLEHTAQLVNSHDITLVEGAGGITTPIEDMYTFADFAEATKLPALLVADGRLGSINRVLLTIDYAKSHNISVIGIIINNQDMTDEYLLASNAQEMSYYTGLPIFGIVPSYQGPRDRDVELEWFAPFIKLDKIEEALQKGL